MKILHVVDSGGIYGKEKVVLNLIREQLRAQDEPYLLVSGKDDIINLLPVGLRSACHVKSILDMFRFLRDQTEDFDAIHTHDYKGNIIVEVLRRIGKLKKPHLSTLHGFTGANKPWYSKIKIYEALDKFFHRFNNAVVGVDETMKENKTLKKRITHIIPNGIENFEFQMQEVPDEFWSMQQDNIIIMCCARLSHEKNIANLIKAFVVLREHKDKLPHYGSLPEIGLKLLIFGDGPERENLEDLIKELDLEPGDKDKDCVHLMGFQINAREYLSIADVYVQPSITEGMPIAVLEAMRSRTLLALSDVGGMKTLVDEGLAACSGTIPMMIAMSIIQLETMAPEQQFLMMEKVTEKFKLDFSSKAMYNRYTLLYKSLIGEK